MAAKTGLAQASQSAAATSPIALAIRSVSSVETIGVVGRSSQRRPLWPKSLEDYLVGMARRPFPVIGAAHRPGQERQAE